MLQESDAKKKMYMPVKLKLWEKMQEKKCKSI